MPERIKAVLKARWEVNYEGNLIGKVKYTLRSWN